MGESIHISRRKALPAVIALLAVLSFAFAGVPLADTDATAGDATEIDTDTTVTTNTEITQNTVVKAGHIYNVQSNKLTIKQGVTFTIEQGASLYVESAGAVDNKGTINVNSNGTAEDKPAEYWHGAIFKGKFTNSGTFASSADSKVRFTAVEGADILNDTGATMTLAGDVFFKSVSFTNKGTLNFSGKVVEPDAAKSIDNKGTVNITGSYTGIIKVSGAAKAVFGNSASLARVTVEDGAKKVGFENVTVAASGNNGLTVKSTASGMEIDGSCGLSKGTGTAKITLGTETLVSGNVSITNVSIVNGGVMKVTGTLTSSSTVPGTVYAAVYKTNAYTYTTLEKAMQAQAADITYTIDSAFTINGDMTVPHKLTIKMPAESKVTVNASKTLTIASTGNLTVKAGTSAADILVNGTLDNKAGDSKLSCGTISGYDAKCIKGTETVYTGLTNALALEGFACTINGNQVITSATIDSGSTLVVPAGNSLTINGTLTVNGKLDVKGTLVFGSAGKLVVAGTVESVNELANSVVKADGAYYSKTSNSVKTYIITTPAKGLADMANADARMMAIYGAFTGAATVEGTSSVQAVLKVFGDYTSANVTLKTNAKLIADAKFAGSIKYGTGEVVVSESTKTFNAVCDTNGLKVYNLETAASQTVTVKANTTVTFISAILEKLVAAGTVTFADAATVKDLDVTGSVTVGSGKLTCTAAHVTGTLAASATGSSVEVGTMYVSVKPDLTVETAGTVLGTFVPTLVYTKTGTAMPESIDALGSIAYKVDGKDWITLYGKSGTAVPAIEPANTNFTGWKDTTGKALPETFGTADITAVAQLSTAIYKVTVEFNSPDVTGVTIDGKALKIENGKYVSELLPAGDHVLKYTLKDGRFGTVKVAVGSTAVSGNATDGYKFKLQGGEPTFNADGTVKDPVMHAMTITYTADAKDIDSITVSGDFKKEYKVFESVDTTNMVVTAKFANGTEKNVVSECAFDPERFTAVSDSVTVTVKYSGLETTFTVKVVEAVTGNIDLEIEDGKVSETQEKELLARIAAAKAADKPITVILDSTGAMKLDMPVNVIKAVYDAKGTLVVQDVQGSVTFTSDAFNGITLEAGKTASLKLAAGEAPENQKDAVGTAKVFEVSMQIDGKDVTKFGAKVKTVIWYTAAEDSNKGNLKLVWLKADGNRDTMDSKYVEGEDVRPHMEMDTDHFSLYAVMEVEPPSSGTSIWLIVGGIIAAVVVAIVAIKVFKVTI